MSEPSGLPGHVFRTLVQKRAEVQQGEGLTPQQIGGILNATAWEHQHEGVGLQSKPTGTRAFMPDGQPIWNGLRFMHEGRHYGIDVCGSCSIGKFNPQQATPGPADSGSFIAPVRPASVRPVDPVDPVAPVGPVDPPAEGAATAALQRDQIAAADRQDATMKTGVDAIKQIGKDGIKVRW